MGVTGVDALDSLQFCLGLYAGQLLFCVNVFLKKEKYAMRLAAYALLSTAAGLLYLPLAWRVQGAGFAVNVTMRLIYWAAASFLVCLGVKICFQATVNSALFRGLLASGLEGICMAVSKYLIVTLWFPQLPEKYFAWYVLLTVLIYAVFYVLTWHFLAVRMQAFSGLEELENRQTLLAYLLFYLIFSLVINTTQYIFETILSKVKQLQDFYGIFGIFTVAVLILLGFLKIGIQYYIYVMAVLRNERNVFERLMEEKRLQYEFSKENIEAVNRKCHDLKHQLLALETADGSERRKMIEETRKAVDFYDSAVRTGNETLDVLLTEKSILCARDEIRFSCMVKADGLERIGIIDLYTMLGNALDNAIECVRVLADQKKRVVSLSVQTKGNVLYFSVENYYENEIRLFHGLPVTSKSDGQNHGIGLRSIQRIAESYGGEIHISTESHIFLLQAVVPLSKK